jgi:hypothetical protein
VEKSKRKKNWQVDLFSSSLNQSHHDDLKSSKKEELSPPERLELSTS